MSLNSNKSKDADVTSYAFNLEATNDGLIITVELSTDGRTETESYVILKDGEFKQSTLLADSMLASTVDKLTDRLVVLFKMIQLANKLKA